MQCDNEAVHAGLGRRLARLAEHPQGNSHEADEVRLALFSAAAQLLDRDVREHLARQGSLSTFTAPDITPGEDPNRAQRMRSFRGLAAPLIVAGGGLNRQTKKRLLALAHLHGLNTREVRQALRPGSASARTAPDSLAPIRNNISAATSATQARTFYEELQGDMDRDSANAQAATRNIAVGTGAFLVLCVIIIGSVAMVLRSSHDHPGAESGAVTLQQPQAQPSGTGAADAEAQSSRKIDEASDAQAHRIREALALREPAEVLGALRDASARYGRNPGDAAWRFEKAIRELAIQWPEFEPAALTAANEAVTDFLYRAPAGSESARRAINAVATGGEARESWRGELNADQLRRFVWASGMLTRLSRERELAPGASTEITSQLSTMLAGARPTNKLTFTEGAQVALEHAVNRLHAPLQNETSEQRLDVWRDWIVNVAGVSQLIPAPGESERKRLREEMFLDASEALLQAVDRTPSKDSNVRNALALLLEQLDWGARRGDERLSSPTQAQLRLVTWLGAMKIPTQELAVVTEWLMRESQAPGVGLSMALARSAKPEEREALRDRYTSAWNIARKTVIDAFTVAWTRAARDEINRPIEQGAILRTLAHAAAISRLNAAAAMKWVGNDQDAFSVVSDLWGPIDRAIAATQGGGASVDEAAAYRDGDWSLAFLSAGRASDRLDAILTLSEIRHPLGQIDADTLAEAAMLTGSKEIRERARRLIRQRRQEATVVNGVLETLPRAPRRIETSELIEDITNESLPSVKDPRWMQQARRTLVETLIELMAGRGELGQVDAMADTIGASYENIVAALGGVSPGSVTGRLSETPAGSALKLWRAWRREADRFALGARSPRALAEIDRRHRGRMQIAKGLVQRFAAAQVGAAEAMAHIIASERPSRAQDVEATMQKLSSERRSAASIDDQILRTELNMLRLWMIRLGVDQSGDDS